MRIVMYPSFVRKDDNPFITILRRSLTRRGIDVRSFNPLLPRMTADALHVHWLEQIFWGRLSKRSVAIQRFIVHRLVAKARRYRAQQKPVVWTVHNLLPHDKLDDQKRSVFQELRRTFLPLVSDVILMSDSITERISDEYPEIAAAKKHVIPHPHYAEFYESLTRKGASRDRARAVLSPPLLVIIGFVRRYKNIPDIIKRARELDSAFTMLIVGDGDADVCRSIRQAVSGDDRFQFDNRKLSHEDVAELLTVADGAVFNFDSILNSGSVLAALSMSVRVLCPRAGALATFEEECGPGWVRLFDGPLETEHLAEFIASLRKVADERCHLPKRVPDLIARAHEQVYFTGASHP